MPAGNNFQQRSISEEIQYITDCYVYGLANLVHEILNSQL